MSGWWVEIQIYEEFAGAVCEAWLRRIGGLVLEPELPLHWGDQVPAEATVTVSLVIADDETLHELNREYLGIDEVTDVLAFPFLFPDQPGLESDASRVEKGSFVLATDQTSASTAFLGEVLVSYPPAMRQAQPVGHGADRELALLVAHGILHLLGYDHAEPQEQARMWNRQDAVLAKLFPEASA